MPGRTRREDERGRSRTRGQTPQDFAIGIVFFLLTVAFVFSAIPSTLTFTEADPGAKEAKQANRISRAMTGDLFTTDSPNVLNGTAVAAWFNDTESTAAIRDDLAVGSPSRINVSVRTLSDLSIVEGTDPNGTVVAFAAGDDYDGQPASEVVRIVEVTGVGGECEPACQLVVRVW